MNDIIVCDLDGTLANCEHRVHYVRNKPKNWDAFYAGVKDDTANFAILNLLHRYAGTYDGSEQNPYGLCDIVFCSGRPERCRDDTEGWLHGQGFHRGRDTYQLYMRKDGDYRADHIVKQEILDAHIDKERVLFVLDDRQQVVDMWRRNGLTCFQVAEGNF